jgi:hypothetical protein
VANYLVRVGLPDRPGALGAVASRIGAVGGDVVAIDILQRDGGVVVDELGVVLAGPDLVGLLRDEILEVDGVTVESLRAVDGPLPDRQAEILEFATDLFRQPDQAAALRYLTARARHSLCGAYAAVLGTDGRAVAVAGEAPGTSALAALVPDPERPDGGVARAWLARAGVLLVVGRAEPVLRTRERLRLSTMAELADHRWDELDVRGATTRRAV